MNYNYCDCLKILIRKHEGDVLLKNKINIPNRISFIMDRRIYAVRISIDP